MVHSGSFSMKKMHCKWRQDDKWGQDEHIFRPCLCRAYAMLTSVFVLYIKTFWSENSWWGSLTLDGGLSPPAGYGPA